MEWLKHRLWAGFNLGFGAWLKVATCKDYGYFSWRVRVKRYRNATCYQWWRFDLIIERTVS